MTLAHWQDTQLGPLRPNYAAPTSDWRGNQTGNSTRDCNVGRHIYPANKNSAYPEHAIVYVHLNISHKLYKASPATVKHENAIPGTEPYQGTPQYVGSHDTPNMDTSNNGSTITYDPRQQSIDSSSWKVNPQTAPTSEYRTQQKASATP